MCNWVFKISGRLKPLVDMLKLAVLSGPLINADADEITLQVLDKPGRDTQSKSYMWEFRGGEPGMPVLYYHYAAGRGGKTEKKFLSGYRNYVQTDSYGGYNFLGSTSEIIHVGCWAHVRRKLNDVAKAVEGKYKDKGKSKANKALSIIGELYLIEREAKNRGFGGDQTFQLRQEKSKPIEEEFGEWLQGKVMKIPPGFFWGKVFNYTFSQWPRLIKYLDSGLIRDEKKLNGDG